MTVLDEIVAGVREDVAAREALTPLAEVKAAARAARPALDALAALRAPGVGVIAEVKRQSPSKGALANIPDPADLARQYAAGGARVISVLTEGRRFGGSLADLAAVRAAVDVPVLRKDFVVSSYQVHEARAHGADLVLLIVAALEENVLGSLAAEARLLDLDCLVEVHDEQDLERALAIDADVIGINNRNLRDLSVDLETTAELIVDVPAGKTVVSESGYDHPEQLAELERIGVDAVLIGESLMRASDPEGAVRALTMDEEAAREHLAERAPDG